MSDKKGPVCHGQILQPIIRFIIGVGLLGLGELAFVRILFENTLTAPSAVNLSPKSMSPSNITGAIFSTTFAPKAITSTANSTSSDPPPMKMILLFNSFWDSPDYGIGVKDEPFRDCHKSRCFTVPANARKSHNISNFDAIVIHGIDFNLDPSLYRSIQRWRIPHQRFIFFMMEPPQNGVQFTSPLYNHFWNYTMTYRLDSDILRLYGAITPLHSNGTLEDDIGALKIAQTAWPVDYDEDHFIHKVMPIMGDDFHRLATRPKKVVWMVSRCRSNSHREDYVKELKKYIDIDVYGKCGTPCNNRECFTNAKDQYKFYLSFENNFARDYVTEKFFLRMRDGLLPIVMGQANYSRIAPPHSYINVLDYDSPKSLANYLLRLDRNNTEYLSYFWWYDQYKVSNGSFMNLAFCELCAKLHEDDVNQQQSQYPNFGKWWHTDSHLDEKLPTLLSLMGE